VHSSLPCSPEPSEPKQLLRQAMYVPSTFATPSPPPTPPPRTDLGHTQPHWPPPLTKSCSSVVTLKITPPARAEYEIDHRSVHHQAIHTFMRFIDSPRRMGRCGATPSHAPRRRKWRRSTRRSSAASGSYGPSKHPRQPLPPQYPDHSESRA
jgi:hypothetical protein